MVEGMAVIDGEGESLVHRRDRERRCHSRSLVVEVGGIGRIVMASDGGKGAVAPDCAVVLSSVDPF